MDFLTFSKNAAMIGVDNRLAKGRLNRQKQHLQSNGHVKRKEVMDKMSPTHQLGMFLDYKSPETEDKADMYSINNNANPLTAPAGYGVSTDKNGPKQPHDHSKRQQPHAVETEKLAQGQIAKGKKGVIVTISATARALADNHLPSK